MQGGKKGLLVDSAKLQTPQNGKTLDFNPLLKAPYFIKTKKKK